jgi:hypothetical protein
MNKIAVWQAARQVMQRVMAHYGDAMEKAAMSIGLEPSDCFLVIIPAYLFDPDSISAARFRKRIPYNSPKYYQAPLLAVKNAGFLDEVQEGGYILNQKGHEAFRKVMDAAYVQMARLSPLPYKQLDELKFLLAKLVQASILSQEHLCKWSILHSRRLDSGRNVASIIAVDQYLSDLSAYRDDAHLASWSSHSIGAHAWDILGVLWQDMALSTTDLIDAIKKRRWTERETRKAISDLVRKGWVKNGEILNLTYEGRQLRNNAEELTDKLFFSPWSVLSDNEYKKLSEYLIQMNKNLAEKPNGFSPA